MVLIRSMYNYGCTSSPVSSLLYFSISSLGALERALSAAVYPITTKDPSIQER